MQRSRVPIRRFKSFKSAIILLAMLVAILLMSTTLERSGMPSMLAGLLHSDFEDFRNLEQFDSVRSEEAQRTLAGFWTYEEGDPKTSPIAKREFLELNANGIVWKVIVWTVNTPTGQRHDITRIIYGFQKPYSYNPTDSSYFSEMRIIRQAYINATDGDRCFGSSQEDIIWRMKREEGEDGTLTLDRRVYQPYTGELSKFFPQPYPLNIVDDISLARCPTALNTQWLARRLLARDMEPSPFFMRADEVISLVHNYYRPIDLDELARRFDPRAVPENMPVRLTIAPDGTVSNLRYRPANIVTKRFDDLAVVMIRTWLFPRLTEQHMTDPQVIDFSIQDIRR